MCVFVCACRSDSQVGVLRVWNVSRSTPLDSFKLKKTGFHTLHVLNAPLTKKGEAQMEISAVPTSVSRCCGSCILRRLRDLLSIPPPPPTAQSSGSPSKSQHTSSTSEAVPPPTLSQNRSFSLPPGHVVCCFMDGGVGLYDMGAKKWDFLRDLVTRNPVKHTHTHTRCAADVAPWSTPINLPPLIVSRVTWKPSLIASSSPMIPTCWPRPVLTEPSRFGTQTR